MIIITLLQWLHGVLIGSNFEVLLPGSDFWNVFNNVMSFVGLVLPFGTVRSILSIVLGLATFRIFVVVLRTIWDLLPWL